MIGTARIVFAVAVIAVVTIVMLPVQLLAILTKAELGKRLPRWWHQVAARLLGLKVHVHGALSPDRPLLIAANHISWCDIVTLGAVADVSFIAKADMANWPIFGMLAKLQRSVFIERENPRKAGEQASDIAGRLANREIIVLFAEGTTSDGNGLYPFKTSLFGAAQFALKGSGLPSVTVQPVAISYTRLHGMPMGRHHRPLAAWIGEEDLLPHLGRFLSEGAIDAEVRFGKPEIFSEASNRKHLGKLMESRVRTMLAESLAGREHSL
jgi:1-acyl-sn-glycerol-3-phosphate acyltransferase